MNFYGETPLFEATDDTIETLLNHGANLYHQNLDEETAIFNPYLSVDTLKFLVEKGLNIDHENKDRLTPLMLRALERDYYEAKLLLEAGANIAYRNYNGKTAAELLYEANKERVEEEYFWTFETELRDLLKSLGFEKPTSSE